MASNTIELMAIIQPKAGKVDRVVDLLSDMSVWVKANEPTTLRYQLLREVNKRTGVETLFMLETYADKNALRAHGSSKEFRAFQKKMKDEDLTEGETQLKFVKPVAGFTSRL